MKQNVLITGGAGFIGSHLADVLVKKYNVIIIDNLNKRVHPIKKIVYIPKGVTFYQKDINDPKLLLKILPKIDFIYHLASHQDHLHDYSKFIDNNVYSTSLIFEILATLKKKRLKQFILASSQSVYGNGYILSKGKKYKAKRKISNLKKKLWHIKSKNEKFIPHKETDPTEPIGFYGLSKLFQENIVKQCCNDHGINFTILRYSIVQGARQSFFNSYSGLCRNLITSYIIGRKPIIFEDGNSIRDFVNIDDVTKANCMILNNQNAFNQIFNIGGGIKYSLIEFNESVKSALKINDIKPIINKSFRLNDPRYTVSNINKIKKLINWIPTNKIDYSINDYIKWLNNKMKYLKYNNNSLKIMKKVGSVIDCY